MNKKNKLLKKSAYVEIDGFVFSVVVGFPDASVEEEENIFPNMDESFPDASVVFPDASVVFPDASLEENGDEKLNASLFDENSVLIGVAPFKNDFI
jgi:hypothetical protein